MITLMMIKIEKIGKYDNKWKNEKHSNPDDGKEGMKIWENREEGPTFRKLRGTEQYF